MNQTKDTMPKEMRAVVTDFFGNLDRLKAEWDLCNAQYSKARETLNIREAIQAHRLEVRKITDYWIRRKQALENSLGKEIVEKFKKS
jgi:hypothetical protein